MLIVGFNLLSKLKEESRINDLTINIYDIDYGFGYNISVNDKILIKQSSIPAIQDIRYFSTKKDAYKVANLVVSKLENNQYPTISLQELINLKINIDYLNEARE
tara:strand:- start:571 stop:882 length:312 start_codon:yes stop_codon:yes gene_type:complete